MATEGPRAAWLAVFHTGSTRGISESALGREKDSDEVKILEARVRALPGRGRAGPLYSHPGPTGRGGGEGLLQS